MDDAGSGASGHLIVPSHRGDAGLSNASGDETYGSAPTIDIGAIVEQQKIGWFAVNLLGWTFAAMFFTGFNFAGIAFVVPSLAREWHIAPGAFGSAFGIGIFGMMLGSLFFGYVGDRIGRKRTLVLGGWIFGIVTLASIWAPGITVLAIERCIAGFGFYAVIPNGIVLVNEFAPKRLKATWATGAFIGFSVGVALAGFVAAWVIPTYGWHSMFVIGGAGPIVVAVIIVFTLPESSHFLALHEARWDELTKIVAKISPETVVGPDTRFVLRHEARQDMHVSPAMLFAGGLKLTTPILWLFYIFNSMAVFFMTSWLPVLIQGVGLTVAHAAITTGVYALGGIVGGLVAGWLVDRLGMLTIALMPTLGAIASAALGFDLSEQALMAVACAAGFFVVGTQNIIMTVAPMIYPTSFRAKGEGTAIAVGKVGAITGPVVGGILLTAHLPVHQLFFAAAAAILCGAILAYVFAALFRRHFAEEHGKAR